MSSPAVYTLLHSTPTPVHARMSLPPFLSCVDGRPWAVLNVRWCPGTLLLGPLFRSQRSVRTPGFALPQYLQPLAALGVDHTRTQEMQHSISS